MPERLSVTRLLEHPIVTPHMDGRMGDNICGPSVIRVPTWVEKPLGRYYLYFSDHKGSYIRLAFADHVAGPWRMHEQGALDISESGFPALDPPEPPPEQRPPWAAHMKGGYLYAHIASPDVHVRSAEREIRMYFHGLLPNGDQATRLAVSTDGLHFEVREPLLGPPYFRVVEWRGRLYTITWGGEIWRSNDWGEPFEKGPTVIHYDPKGGIGEGFRHGETMLLGDTLFILFTRMGDAPERIVYCSVDMNASDWKHWTATETRELMRPEAAWEGTDLPIKVSTMGAERHRVHELRDPCVFVDGDDEKYLFYCGAGESAIGVAKLSVA